MRLTVTVQRCVPGPESRPYDQEYRLDFRRGLTVLEALIRIKNEVDGGLGLRYSCRSAICGSCAMTINGTEKLACRTSVRQEFERRGRIHVAPLKNLPLIKDLVVDLAPFWSKVRSVTPWLSKESAIPPDPTTGRLTIRREAAQFHNVDGCIMCGACVSACTTHEVSRGFLGPAALAKAERFVADPREPDTVRLFRLHQLQEPDGIWDCTRCNMCVQVCPKDVKPMEAIVRLRRASLERGIPATAGARHISGFVQLIQQQGRLNEALMPLKVVGFEPRRLVAVLPLGLRMLLRGKLPNPLGHPIAGIGQIHAIFAASRTRAARPAYGR